MPQTSAKDLTSHMRVRVLEYPHAYIDSNHRRTKWKL